MFVTECVVAVLGALAGTYPTETLTLFRFNEETQRHYIFASAIPSGIKSSLFVRLDFPSLAPYVKNNAIIKGTGNIFRVCPGRVTSEDCKGVYRVRGREYNLCENLVRSGKHSIIFARDKFEPRSMVKLLVEVRERNNSPDGVRCFNSLQSANEPSLSKLPRDCSHENVRDLLYGRKLKLTGDHGCKDLGVDAELSLNADIPLTINLNRRPLAFLKGEIYHFFITDGMQILHLRPTVMGKINKKMEWIAEREGTQGTMKISEVLDNLETLMAYQARYLSTRFGSMRYQVCPFMKSLSLARNV